MPKGYLHAVLAGFKRSTLV